jgi:hypothetical protein
MEPGTLLAAEIQQEVGMLHQLITQPDFVPQFLAAI